MEVDNTGKRLYYGSLWSQTIRYIDLETNESKFYVGAPYGMSDDVSIGPDNQIAWTQLIGNGTTNGSGTDFRINGSVTNIYFKGSTLIS
jgi:hypothetical protein